MGSSPNLGFGWVRVLARGVKSQSEVHGFNIIIIQVGSANGQIIATQVRGRQEEARTMREIVGDLGRKWF